MVGMRWGCRQGGSAVTGELGPVAGMGMLGTFMAPLSLSISKYLGVCLGCQSDNQHDVNSLGL